MDIPTPHTEIVQHHIPTKDCTPVLHPPYLIPAAWKEKVWEEVQGMLEADNHCAIFQPMETSTNSSQ